MKLSTFVQKHRKLLVVLGIFLIALMLLGNVAQEGSIGYLSGTQGLEVQFNSLKWRGYWWSATEKGPPTAIYGGYTATSPQPSIRSFGFTMDFDPDLSYNGMSDIAASTQVMTRQSDVPLHTYTWQVPTGRSQTLTNGTVVSEAKQFEIYQYRMDWAMNLWLGGPEAESDGYLSGYWGAGALYLTSTNWGSSELWLKIVPKSFVYFQDNPEQVFFAPCYIALAEPVQYAGIDINNQKILNDPEMAALEDIIPESTGESIGIYYQRGGADTNLEQTILSYQGVNLDTSIFRNEYWSRINLVNFLPKSTGQPLAHRWKYPSAYMHFIVDVFVVGQWTVYYKTGEIPALEPHYPSVQYDWFSQLTNAFTSPLGQLWIFFILIIVVLVLVTFFNPGLWTMIVGMFRNRKGGGKQ